MDRVTRILAGVLLLERAWKHWMVVRFFRRSVPAAKHKPRLVSIIQPILSGDPTMPSCLERSLTFRSSYEREYLWLVDTTDQRGQHICRDLMARYPATRVRLMLTPRSAPEHNPKMVKLIAAAQVAAGDVLCVLDDDTQLPDWGLEECLPYLDQANAGVAFGLPYYVNFSNVWSGLLSTFVNSHSLLTYIPYTVATEPFTINGMFYAVKRETLDTVGGFDGLETWLADDFAVAQRFRDHGYRLIQTPLCHGISTQVTDARHYASLIQRWFIFPRESLMRHLRGRDRAVLYGLGMAPVVLPLMLVIGVLARPTRRTTLYALAPLIYNLAIFTHLNRRYLRRASPWFSHWLVPVLEIVFPVQLLAALLTPQRISWRGHLMAAERGGNLRILRRRDDEDQS